MEVFPSSLLPFLPLSLSPSLPSILPSFLLPSLPSFLPSSLPSFLPSFLSYLGAYSLTGIVIGVGNIPHFIIGIGALNQTDKFTCSQKLTFYWGQTINK